MYRNIAYLPTEGVMRLYTWDDNGVRIETDVKYNPYFYLETNNAKHTEGMSIFNTPVRKIEFLNEYKRREAVDKHLQEIRGDTERKEVRLFENISPAQQFLVDRFWKDNNTPEFTKFPIRYVFIDIETYSPNAFPVPDKATDTVNVITLYDSITKQFHTWGLNPYTAKLPNHTYNHCPTEKELLTGFVRHIKKDCPDIISGWNSEFFDIPYLINRITKLLGEDMARELSPVRSIYSREVVSQFGKYNVRWHIKGTSCVDYLDIYKKFSQGLRESYKLNDIAEHELGEKKVEFGDTNLASLSVDNWELFVDYNIQDVNLLVKMEEKLLYIQLLRMLAYIGLSPLENAMGTLNVITGAAVIQARARNQILPTFEKTHYNDSKFEGAYVGEPRRGFRKNVISFDVNSLYPNVMITLNLSPETKMGKMEVQPDGKILLTSIGGKSATLTKENFLKVVESEQLALSKAGVLFSQKKKGIFPQIVDNRYKERVEIRKIIKKLNRELQNTNLTEERRLKAELQVTQLNIKQHTIKIFINTVYGYFGNKHAPMGDQDISRSITLTGQSIIKESNNILRKYISKNWDIPESELLRNDPVIYNDTDSVYVSIESIINKTGIKFSDSHNKITKDTYNIVDNIEAHLNDEILKWGKLSLNSVDCRFEFKRESICDVGLFLQKKRYILHILDDEGIPVNKFKYTGVEVVRTTMPKAIKPHVKKVVETMILTQDLYETNKLLNEMYDIFKSLPIEDTSFTIGISNYKIENLDESGTLKDKCDGFKTYKGMPIHVKGAYYHNTLITRLGLESKYEMIASGDKIKYMYVKQPNRYGIKTVAYKRKYPKEFVELLSQDTETMFDKIVFSMMERLYDAVGWSISKPGMSVKTSLLDLFSNDYKKSVEN